MTALAKHQASQVTKLLLIGESGSGKSGSLASLAAAGYNLRLLDYESGADILYNMLSDPKSPYPPEALQRVHFKTLTEHSKSVNGRIIPTKASVWSETMKILDSGWKEGEPGSPDFADFGKLSTWTSKDVLVIDSFTALGNAAFNFLCSMNGKLGVLTEGNEWRRTIGQAQVLMEKFLEYLYDSSIQCNIVVISHITYVDEQGQVIVDGESKSQIGYPSALGRALSPKVPRYFNSMLLLKTVGTGQGTRRVMYTQPQGVVAAKSSAPLRAKPSYPIETGLADYFKAVRGE
jgi:hypothetical protein